MYRGACVCGRHERAAESPCSRNLLYVFENRPTLHGRGREARLPDGGHVLRSPKGSCHGRGSYPRGGWDRPSRNALSAHLFSLDLPVRAVSRQGHRRAVSRAVGLHVLQAHQERVVAFGGTQHASLQGWEAFWPLGVGGVEALVDDRCALGRVNGCFGIGDISSLLRDPPRFPQDRGKESS